MTCHDGFTLADLVSYNDKHNEANREGNRDGTDDNRSWNCGAEGPTDDPDGHGVAAAPAAQLRRHAVPVAGRPMLLHGDETGRTQWGNNNAYCQDNEVSWVDWDHVDEGLLSFTAAVDALRRQHAVFRRSRWFEGRPVEENGVSDIGWFVADGRPMSDRDWQAGFAKTIGVFLNGDALPWLDPRGHPVRSDTFLMLFNAHTEPVDFVVPGEEWGREWRVILDTTHLVPRPDPTPCKPGDRVRVIDHGLVLLQRTTPGA